MKRYSYLIALIAIFSIGAASCKKCIHCVEKDGAGAVAYDYGEACGKKKDVERFEEQAKALVDPGNTLECHDN